MRWLLLVTLVACSKKQPPPANEFEGAKYFPMNPDLSPAQAWKEAQELWAEEGPTDA